uniref:DUF4216 domain-containing protein n=1 Tax=Noccaea caerulescens TaxID=107243 RepID=A0A1J3DLZ4_NOCCA
MYCTRGYVFHTYKHGMRKSTANYGIHVPGETEFYGVLQEIVEVTYPGIINLKCIMFKCDWYDPTLGRGVRRNETVGVTDVNANRKFSKFEPFILASQAEQVCFIPYPRVRQKRETWLSVIKVNPRGYVFGLDDEVAMQHDRVAEVSTPIETTENIMHVDPENREVEDVIDDSTEDEESDEFEEPPTDDDEREHSENLYESE